MTSPLINNFQSQGSSLNSQNINISNYKDIINNIPSTLSFTYTTNNNINNNINNNQIGHNKQIYIGTVNNYRQIGVPNNSKIIPLKPGNKRSISPQLNPSKNNYLGQGQYYNGKGIFYNGQNRIPININNNFNYSQPNQKYGNYLYNAPNFYSYYGNNYESLNNPKYTVDIGVFNMYVPFIGEDEKVNGEKKQIIKKPPIKKLDPRIAKQKLEEKIQNENKNMLERQHQLRYQIPEEKLFNLEQPNKNNPINNGKNFSNLNNPNDINQQIKHVPNPIILGKNPNINSFNPNIDINHHDSFQILNNNKNKIEEEKQKDKKINTVLEDMCIYGNIAEKKIKEEKKENNPKKIILTETALKEEKKDPGLFALGLISHILEKNNIETVIEAESNEENKEEVEDLAITSLQFLTNGLIGKKKYDLFFDLPEERVDQLLFNQEEYEKFKETLKTKVSEDYKVPKEKIIIAFPQRGSFHVQLIFQSDEFNDLDCDDFERKFKNDKKYKELSQLKRVQSKLIMGGCHLSKYQLDPRGNRSSDWGVNENRGGEHYNAPVGWIGIGLKVFDKFFDDRWLDMKNLPGEWVVAYHGVGSGLQADEVMGIPGAIIDNGFKAGRRQAHKDCDDSFHPGQKVGEGVYCTPLIRVAEEYAGVCNIKGKKYKIVIMARVNPKARRHCNSHKESKDYQYWVVNGTTDEIRPYRILYKKI